MTLDYCRLFALLLLVSYGFLSESSTGIEAYFAFILKVTPRYLKQIFMDLLQLLEFEIYINDAEFIKKEALIRESKAMLR